MLTPVFDCSQADGFLVVRLYLSAICKVMDAVFDIHETQFTFYCSPYYLRLRFDQSLQEGKGERATYDLEANVLTVYLPKANPAETFTKLDNPAYLIATEKQRAALIQEIGGSDTKYVEGGVEDTEETEYVQVLQDTTESTRIVEPGDQPAIEECSYGFANAFSGLFDRLDVDIVRDVVSLQSNPEHTTRAQRRQLRRTAEEEDFDEDALLLAFEDAEGEIAQVLRYVPSHMKDFLQALRGGPATPDGGVRRTSSTTVYASVPHTDAAAEPRHEEALEEDEPTLLKGEDVRPVTVWSGNVGDFKKPLIEELPSSAAEALSAPSLMERRATMENSSVPSAQPMMSDSLPRTRLAIPKTRPCRTFTPEETDLLLRLKMPRLLFPPSPTEVEALTADLLFSEAYDDLVTEGCGCSESLWNLTQLSPALSYLDPADTIYDACVAFARRALVYPLYRHCAILQRIWAVVGTRLLLGRNDVVRALLRVRRILSHAEHKHLLSTVYLDPLIGYWMHIDDADGRLMRMALELHQHASRTEPLTVSSTSKATSLAIESIWDSKKKILYPLALRYFGLPFTAEGPEDDNEVGAIAEH